MKIPTFQWFSNRWIEFRFGYSGYVTFFLGFSNFSLIAYNFIPQIKDLVPVWIFAPVVLLGLVPIAIIAGRWHHNKHMPSESIIGAKHNYYRDRILPNSKEVFFAKYGLDSAEAMAWQLEVQRRQMVAINDIMKKLGMEGEFTPSDMERSQDRAEKLGKWPARYDGYIEGKDTSTLP